MQPDVEGTKKKTPILTEVKIDEKTGDLFIESVNIDKFTIKYYLIDAEILFSRSPFIQKEAHQFSYVNPFLKLEQSTVLDQTTTVPLPIALQGKNVVIEINSDDIQEFKSFYSSNLMVEINESFGELRIFNRQTQGPLSKVYVKVFGQNKKKNEFFWKDGFTDVTGKFEYANVQSKSLKKIKKFSIFVCDDESNNGSCIKEATPPDAGDSDDESGSEDNDYYGEYGYGECEGEEGWDEEE